MPTPGDAGVAVLWRIVLASAGGGSPAAGDFDGFLAEAVAELSRLLPAPGDASQADYVQRAAARLRQLPAPPAVAWQESRKLDIKPVADKGVFSVTLLRAKPGAVLPPHNHPLYSVATMGLQGEVLVRNFHPQGDLPPYASKAAFRLRQTREVLLRPGITSTLTPSRDNFHTFEAGREGAVWIDLSTPHGGPGAGDFSYLRLTAPPKTGETVEARWGLKG